MDGWQPLPHHPRSSSKIPDYPTPPTYDPPTHQLATHRPTVSPPQVTDVSGSCLFRLPETNSQILAAFFADVENNKAALGVTDFSVGQATLEDVFLNLSLKADEEDEEKKEREHAEEMAALEVKLLRNSLVT